MAAGQQRQLAGTGIPQCTYITGSAHTWLLPICCSTAACMLWPDEVIHCHPPGTRTPGWTPFISCTAGPTSCTAGPTSSLITRSCLSISLSCCTASLQGICSCCSLFGWSWGTYTWGPWWPYGCVLLLLLAGRPWGSNCWWPCLLHCCSFLLACSEGISNSQTGGVRQCGRVLVLSHVGAGQACVPAQVLLVQ